MPRQTYRIRVGIIPGAANLGFRPDFEAAQYVCTGEDDITQIEIPYSELAMYVRAAGRIPRVVLVDPALTYAHVQYEKDGTLHTTHGLLDEVVPWVVRRFLWHHRDKQAEPPTTKYWVWEWLWV